MEILVDDEDYQSVIKINWHIAKFKNTFYAIKNGKRIGGGKRENQILLHRFILGITDSNILIDHKDHNGLNCQKSNIRVCNYSQNNTNKRKRENSASIRLGVFKSKSGKWFSNITSNGITECLGTFLNEEDAAKAYDSRAKELHGEFANLNFK